MFINGVMITATWEIEPPSKVLLLYPPKPSWQESNLWLSICNNIYVDSIPSSLDQIRHQVKAFNASMWDRNSPPLFRCFLMKTSQSIKEMMVNGMNFPMLTNLPTLFSIVLAFPSFLCIRFLILSIQAVALLSGKLLHLWKVKVPAEYRLDFLGSCLSLYLIISLHFYLGLAHMGLKDKWQCAWKEVKLFQICAFFDLGKSTLRSFFS